MQVKTNLVTSLSSSSTNDQYTGAKLVYDELVQRDEAIAELEAENEQLLGQIPTATATGETINVQDSSNLPINDFAMLGNAEQTPTTWQYVGELRQNTNYKFTINNVDYYFTSMTDSATLTYIFNNATMKITDNEDLGIEMSVSTTALASTTTITFSAPTPDNPVPINVVTGDNTVKVLGKNLFDKDTATYRNGWYINSDGVETSSTASGYTTSYVEVKPNTTYTFQGQIKSPSILQTVAIYYYDNEKSWIERYPLNSNNSNPFQFTTPNGCYFIRFQYIMQYFYANTVQIEQGSTATDFEPYTEQTQLLSLGSIELAKIGDYQDRIFKQDGKWWWEKNIGEIVLDQSSDLIYQNRPNPTSTVVKTTIATNSDNYISNRFVYGEGEDNKLVIADNNTKLYIRLSNDKTGVTADDSRTIVDNKFKTWLGNNNTLVYYILNTPTTTEITDSTLIAQLENVLKMQTNKNITNAWLESSGDNAQGGLIIDYYQDQKTINDGLQKQIDELKARATLLE